MKFRLLMCYSAINQATKKKYKKIYSHKYNILEEMEKKKKIYNRTCPGIL